MGGGGLSFLDEVDNSSLDKHLGPGLSIQQEGREGGCGWHPAKPSASDLINLDSSMLGSRGGKDGKMHHHLPVYLFIFFQMCEAEGAFDMHKQLP